MSERAAPTRLASTPPVSSSAVANDVRAPDPYVERAITAMRAAPSRKWTVAALARVAGLSRAPFARRFRAATDTTPLRWLAEHRLGLARDRLIARDEVLAAIAEDVGYRSEFAFSKAFKRLFGVAPGVFRRTALPSTRLPAGPTFRAAA